MTILVPKHRHFIEGNTVYWDCETTGRFPWRGDRPFAFSFINDAGDRRYFEWDVDPLTRTPIVRPDELKAMARLLEDTAIRKVGHNTKFDCQMMHCAHGVRTAGCVWDTMWMAHVCNSAELKHGLKPLCDKYGVLEVKGHDDETDLGKAVQACRREAKKLGWKIATDELGEEGDSAYKADYWLPRAVCSGAPAKVIAALLDRWPSLDTMNRTYAEKDAFRCGALCHFYTQIMDREQLWDVYNRELQMASVTYRAEEVGVRIFPERCVILGVECRDKLEELRVSLSKIFGEFNAEVPDQKVRRFLFSKEEGCLGLPIKAYTDKGRKLYKGEESWKGASIAKEVLNTVKDVEAVDFLRDFSKYRKVWSDYVQKYMHHGVEDGRGHLVIHTNFRQLRAITGRMAAADPPLQQTPKRAAKGDIMKRVRWPFGPRKGNVWIHYDYISIEPHILAEESEDPDLIRIFNDGMACERAKDGWTHDPYEILVDRVALSTAKTRDYLEQLFEPRGGARQVCKNNFLGWTYGEGVRKLADQMGCSYEEAADIIAALKVAFRSVQPFMAFMQEMAKRDGCIRNRYGRKAVIPPPSRVFDEEMACWRWIEWWYKATNYLIQGTAADMLKEAAIRLGGPETIYTWAPNLGGVMARPCRMGYLKNTGAEIVLFIHDELVIEMPAKRALRDEKFVRGIGEVMSDNGGKFTKVTTPVDAKITWDAWSDPEDIDTLWK
jgi:DNA polymerase I-like protein with 3'-5' exonuclease and polymerase domains